ncbi:MAG: hypothetical protein IPH32_09405 [Bacteroidetes bacterium]|nr:hypothetical protein [Bacteroidota bacterium]
MKPTFQIVKNKKWFYVVLLIIFLVPTYFIHSQNYPDWGDDFAQYVYQSQQINSPSPIYNQVLNVEEYSSPKRSVFFSVILSVVNPTIEIQQYVNLISISYILAAVCFFLFLSKHFSLIISFLGSLCVFYNFLFLRLKSEVVPEFLFISLFCLVLLLLYSKKNWVRFIIPILLGLLVSVRFIGLSLLLAYAAHLLLSKENNFKEKLKELAICFGIFGIVTLCINYFFLNAIKNQEVTLYGNVVLSRLNVHQFFDNVSMYSRYITLFFEQEIPFWMNAIIKCSVIFLFIIGIIYSIKNRINILHFAFLFYLLFLLVYPYNGDTIKYLIPIVPLFIYFMIYGFNKIIEKINFKYKPIFIVGFLCAILLSNSKTIWLAMNHVSNQIGPYNTEALKDLKKVKELVSAEKTIAFGKPFIINLLCDRHSYFVGNKNYVDVFSKADYFLSPKQNVQELFPKINGIQVAKGDTIELKYFYLIKL